MSSPMPEVRPGARLPVCTITFSQALIDRYAEVSGDFNPIHVNPDAGIAAGFGSTIAHGCIPMEPLFQALQQWSGLEPLPADTAIRLRYRAPSRPGDTIRAEAQVVEERLREGRRSVAIAFVCRNQRDEMVIDGECEMPL